MSNDRGLVSRFWHIHTPVYRNLSIDIKQKSTTYSTNSVWDLFCTTRVNNGFTFWKIILKNQDMRCAWQSLKYLPSDPLQKMFADLWCWMMYLMLIKLLGMNLKHYNIVYVERCHFSKEMQSIPFRREIVKMLMVIVFGWIEIWLFSH